VRTARETVRLLLVGVLWAASVIALCLPLPAPLAQSGAPEWSRMAQATGVWFAAALALGLGYRKLFWLPRAFTQVRFWLLAALFAVIATLGMSFAQTGTAELVTANPWWAMVTMLGRVPALYMGMALLATALANPRTVSKGDPSDARGMPARVSRTDGSTRQGYVDAGEPDMVTAARQPSAQAVAVTAARSAISPPAQRGTSGAVQAGRAMWPTWAFVLLLLVGWLPYLWTVWPGTVSNDSITQLAEVLGRKPLGNANPLFQTGLVWLAVTVGQGWLGSGDAAVALYVCVQGILLAWLLGYTLRRIAESGAPGWLTGLSAVFFMLCPIFPTFAFCMGKDTAFAMAALWLTLMAWRVLESKWPPLRTTAGLCLSAALCALTRNAGAVLAAATLVGLLLYALAMRTRQWRAPLAALAVATAVILTLYGVAIPRLGAASIPETENWSIPLQQAARTAISEPLTAQERAAIDAVLPLDALAAAYNGELSDPVKALWRADVTAEQQQTFWQTWLRLGVKHPATYLSATFHNAYGYLLPGFVSTIKPTFLLGMEGRTTLIDGAFAFTVNPSATALKRTLQTWFSVIPFRLLVSPGGYGWLTLFAFAAVMSARKRRNALCMIPALLTLAGCLCSAVNGYFRYALPLYALTPVLLALAAQALRSGLRKRFQPEPMEIRPR